MATERKTTQAAITTELVRNAEGRIGGLRLTFSNGKRIELAASSLSAEIIEAALWHGLKQKLVDAAAISRDPETGRAATIDTKFEAVDSVFQRLLAGDWNKTREGGAGGSGGLLFRALCRIYAGRKSPEALREFLDRKSDAEKAALRKTAAVAAMIETIKAEAAKTAGIDGAELLAELEGEEKEECGMS